MGIVECKDHSRKKGPDAVEAFAKKCENVGANMRMMVSRRGFTPQALKLAKHESIGCLSLLPGDTKNRGFSIGEYWYGVIRAWTNLRIGTKPLPHEAFIQEVDPTLILIDGKPVYKWFLRELLTKHQYEVKNEEYTLTISFASPRLVDCAGQLVQVDQLFCIADRLYQKKRRWINWNGDALYDWHEGTFTINTKGIIRSSAIETDLNAWPDYDGPLPDEILPSQAAGFLTATLLKEQRWNESEDALVPEIE